MRFLEIPRLDFTRNLVEPETRKITDMRVIQVDRDLSKRSDYFLTEKEELDFVATKVFGVNKENLWYRIADLNAQQIIAWRADFSKIRNLKI